MKRCGLRFVTSSIEKKELAASIKKEETNGKDAGERKVEKNGELKTSASNACEIAVVEGSVEGSNGSVDTVNMMDTDVGCLMATTNSMTAVVAANEEVKQSFADDLNSTSSSPCEWFICDDDRSSTRYFVIQVWKIKRGYPIILQFTYLFLSTVLLFT